MNSQLKPGVGKIKIVLIGTLCLSIGQLPAGYKVQVCNAQSEEAEAASESAELPRKRMRITSSKQQSDYEQLTRALKDVNGSRWHIEGDVRKYVLDENKAKTLSPLAYSKYVTKMTKAVGDFDALEAMVSNIVAKMSAAQKDRYEKDLTAANELDAQTNWHHDGDIKWHVETLLKVEQAHKQLAELREKKYVAVDECEKHGMAFLGGVKKIKDIQGWMWTTEGKIEKAVVTDGQFKKMQAVESERYAKQLERVLQEYDEKQSMIKEIEDIMTPDEKKTYALDAAAELELKRAVDPGDVERRMMRMSETKVRVARARRHLEDLEKNPRK